MTDSNSSYTPPEVWTWNTDDGLPSVTSTDLLRVRPTTKNCRLEASASALLVRNSNGVKVTVLLEELLALGYEGAEYDAFLINIGEGNQFGSGFVEINPNSKIPALLDRSTNPPTRVFESGAILVYLAEKFEFCLMILHSVRNACPGFFGKWERSIPGWRVWPLLRLCARKV